MNVTRSVSAGPTRSVEQTCARLTRFTEEILLAYGHPAAGLVRAKFAAVLPLLRFLLTTRAFADPALTVATAELHVDIRVEYDPGADEDLSVPVTGLLASPGPQAPVVITIYGAREVAGELRRVAEAASGDGFVFAFAVLGTRPGPLGPGMNGSAKLTGESIADRVNEEFENALADLGKFNLAIFGKTGAGKSTLVNAIFGEELAKTGVGSAVTKQLTLYSRPDGILRVYDSRGFEMGESREQVLDDVAKQVAKTRMGDVGDYIHAVWYAIRAADRRLEKGQEELIRHLAGLGLPVLLVLTQTPLVNGRPDEKTLEFARSIQERRLPLSPAGQVFFTNALADEILPTVHGLDELLSATFAVVPEAARSALAAAQQIDLGRKREKALRIVRTSVAAAAAIGASPIPFSDSLLLVPNEIQMIARITAAYGLGVQLSTVSGAVAALLDGVISQMGASLAGSLLKLVPGAGSIIGGAINAATASSVTWALGRAWMALCETAVVDGRRFEELLGSPQTMKLLESCFKEFWAKRGERGEL
ncbi:MAG: 50S ribosome-binding GTPase [Microbispora sp.]|nr:50S ribosome-binding GTPase [Microbispora sp.]